MKIISLFLVLAVLAGCSSDEDRRAEERRARIERELAEETKKKNEENDRVLQEKLQVQAQIEEQRQAEEAARPKEPEYMEVDVRTFYSNSVDAKGVTCENMEDENCGVTFTDCDNGMIYRCLHDFKYIKKTVKRLVPQE